MTYFIQCTIPEIIYRNSAVQNHAVNIDLCTSLHKLRFAWYPDNVGLPSIRFVGTDVEWVFKTVDDRNFEFDRIVFISQRHALGKN